MRPHRSAGGGSASSRAALAPNQPASSRPASTSARQRGHLARWFSTSAASSGSTASRTYAPSKLFDLVVLSVVGHGVLHPALDERPAHPPQAVADPALHRPFGLGQQGGHLAVGVAPVVGQLDGRPLLLGQRGHGPGHLVGHGQVPDLAFEVVAGVRRGPGVLLLPPRPGRPGPDQVDGPAVRLGQQERPQRTPVRVEAVRLAPQAQEDLLGHVLRRRPIPGDPPGQAEDGTAVPPVHLGQGALVPRGRSTPPIGRHRGRSRHPSPMLPIPACHSDDPNLQSSGLVVGDVLPHDHAYHDRRLQGPGRSARYQRHRLRRLPGPSAVPGRPALPALHARRRASHRVLSPGPADDPGPPRPGGDVLPRLLGLRGALARRGPRRGAGSPRRGCRIPAGRRTAPTATLAATPWVWPPGSARRPWPDPRSWPCT